MFIKPYFIFYIVKKIFIIGVYISLAPVTLCRLGGPVVFIYGAPGGRRRGGGTVLSRTTRLPPHERLRGSEADSKRGVTHPIQAAVTGSGDSVCLCLRFEAAGVGSLVPDPLAPQTGDAGQSHATPRTVGRVDCHRGTNTISAGTQMTDGGVLVVKCHDGGGV